jgi:RNA polymerase sigma factor (sigma-70 family)
MTTNEKKLEGLWDEHLTALVLYAMRRCASRQDAMDVVAEVYLVAWRKIDKMPAGPEARLWLFTVARMVLANQRRGEIRRTRLAQRLLAEIRVYVPAPAEVPHRAALVESALSELTEASRELMVLVTQDGLNTAEAARVLGIPASTARVRLHRARSQIRRVIESSSHYGVPQGRAEVPDGPTENLEVI